jgi:hypothetical protein
MLALCQLTKAVLAPLYARLKEEQRSFCVVVLLLQKPQVVKSPCTLQNKAILITQRDSF